MNSAPQTSHSGRARLFGWPWYPFIVALYPLWSIYANNLGQVAAVSAAAASAVVLVVTGVLLWVAIRLTRSRHVGALALTVIILAFYSYGAARDLAVRLTHDPPLSPWLSALFDPFTSNSVLTLVMLALCGLLVFLVVRRLAVGLRAPDGRVQLRGGHARRHPAGAHGGRRLAAAQPARRSRRSPASPLATSSACSATTRTSTTSSSTVMRVPTCCASTTISTIPSFSRASKSAASSVNDSSRANYYWTFLSLASSLNYDYLQDIAAPLFADPETTTLRNGYDHVARLAQDNRAAHFLRARGYRYVHIQSSTPPTVRNPYADEQVTCKGGLFDDEYFRTLAEVTWLRVGGSLASADLAECHKLRLRSLGDQAQQPGPKFVFAHFLPPHHPYLFDRHGNVLKHVTISNQFDFQAQLWEDKHGYLEQVLLHEPHAARSDRPHPGRVGAAADHHRAVRPWSEPAWWPAARRGDGAAFRELCGLPAAGCARRARMPRDCAPVNQFRYLFNHYFDARLPILPDRNFFSTYGTPLRMQEVAAISPTGNES